MLVIEFEQLSALGLTQDDSLTETAEATTPDSWRVDG